MNVIQTSCCTRLFQYLTREQSCHENQTQSSSIAAEANRRTPPECPSNILMHSPVSTFHTRTVLSSEPTQSICHLSPKQNKHHHDDRHHRNARTPRRNHRPRRRAPPVSTSPLIHAFKKRLDFADMKLALFSIPQKPPDELPGQLLPAFIFGERLLSESQRRCQQLHRAIVRSNLPTHPTRILDDSHPRTKARAHQHPIEVHKQRPCVRSIRQRMCHGLIAYRPRVRRSRLAVNTAQYRFIRLEKSQYTSACFPSVSCADCKSFASIENACPGFVNQSTTLLCITYQPVAADGNKIDIFVSRMLVKASPKNHPHKRGRRFSAAIIIATIGWRPPTLFHHTAKHARKISLVHLIQTLRQRRKLAKVDRAVPLRASAGREVASRTPSNRLLFLPALPLPHRARTTSLSR